MTRREQNIGKHGEELAASTLRSLGVEMVQKVATPVLVSRASGKPVIVAWGETVNGDFHGILPGGRYVLAEVKTILDRNLRYSDLREHQPDALSEHAEWGGLSILIWVHGSGVYPMIWPIPEFTQGKSISVEMAQQRMIYGLP